MAASWRKNREGRWYDDIGYKIQDILTKHRYVIEDRGSKPDDPGWHACTCGWEGYWSDFHPHLADLIRELCSGSERIHITEYPNGKIRSIVADGTHWITVSQANSRADTASREVDRLNAERDDLRAQVEAQREQFMRVTRTPPEHPMARIYDEVLALMKEKP